MNLSYWEYKTWLSNIDFTVVGSGIVGLNCAIQLKTKHPRAKVLVLEKGILPQGASTKNAGFACFGSISEILHDLRSHSEEEVLQLVQQRWNGIQLLRKNLGDDKLDYQNHGGHEIFLKNQSELFGNCRDKLDQINQLLEPIFKEAPFELQKNIFKFKGVEDHYISHRFESQLDTGTMMSALLELARKKGIIILNNIKVASFSELNGTVSIKTDQFVMKSNKLLIATNGFANELLNEELQPARAQVLITEPIQDLHINGTFHFDEGYYYFRNIDNRILFGGGRNLDFEGEETALLGETELIQNKLEQMMDETILPNTPYTIERRWSGIMGLGPKKKPIVKRLTDNVCCGVRLGGMGIAIGTSVGGQLAALMP